MAITVSCHIVDFSNKEVDFAKPESYKQEDSHILLKAFILSNCTMHYILIHRQNGFYATSKVGKLNLNFPRRRRRRQTWSVEC